MKLRKGQWKIGEDVFVGEHRHGQRGQPHRPPPNLTSAPSTALSSRSRPKMSTSYTFSAARAEVTRPPRRAHLGEVAHPAQQAVGDPRCAPGPPGDLRDALLRQPPPRGSAPNDAAAIPARGARRSPGARRSRSGRASGRSADPARVVAPTRVNGATSSGIAVAPGPLPTITSTRKSSIAHVEHLLGRPGDPVDLVDEQHVALGEAGQHRGQVARALDAPGPR